MLLPPSPLNAQQHTSTNACKDKPRQTKRGDKQSHKKRGLLNLGNEKEGNENDGFIGSREVEEDLTCSVTPLTKHKINNNKSKFSMK